MIAPVLDWTALGIASRKYFAVSGIPTQLLVLHSAECPLAPGYAQSLTKWASPTYPAGPEASWQRFVGPDVRLRFIPDDLGAWAASEANGLSISWEQSGYARFSRAEWLTADGLKQIDNLAYDMAEVAIRDGIPTVWLSDAQVRSVLDSGNRNIKGFCTHRQIDPETRTDPGDGYPLDLLMTKIRAFVKEIKGGSATPTTPEDTVGYKRLVGKSVRTRLAAGKTWHFATADGKAALNLAVGGTNKHYNVLLHLQGTDLPAGEFLDVTFKLTPVGGDASYYYPKKIFADKNGEFADDVLFSMPITGPSVLNAVVTSSVESAYIDSYGADVTTSSLA